MPANPTGWLVTTARRRAVDQLRRRERLARRLPLLVVDDTERSGDLGAGAFADALDQVDRAAGREVPVVFDDDLLRLLFVCCHPSLAAESQVALTARLACGLRTDEVARLLVVNEATMAARVTRAKKKVAAAGIPFRVPTGAELPARLDGVLTVVHLLLTAGHTAPVGAGLVRDDLLTRATGLTASLARLMPDEPEVLGLHALGLLTWARRDGRTGADGRLLLLAEQDRSRWDAATIAEADALVRRALVRAAPGRFVLQAAVAACHATAPSYEATDWQEVLGLYDVLLRVWPNPVVALNRAVAVAEVAGPAAGLAALETAGVPGTYPYLHAVRADLLRRLGRTAGAREAYATAAALTGNDEERRFLLARRDALA